MTATTAAPRARTARRGAHRLPAWRNLARRTRRELGRTQPKHNAGRVARQAVACLALAVLTACLAGDIPPVNTTITAVALGAALFLTGVIL